RSATDGIKSRPAQPPASPTSLGVREPGNRRFHECSFVPPARLANNILRYSREIQQTHVPLFFLSGIFGSRNGSCFPWLFLFTSGGRLGIFLVAAFYDVLHDQRDAAVGGIEGIVRLTKTLIGEAANLGDLT